MNKNELAAKLEPILSNREIEVVLKRLGNKHITQTESNYLSRSIRPKLKSAEFAVSAELLSLLDYRRKRYEREDSLLKEKIIKAVKKGLADDIKAIVLFGSYIRNSHTNYRDIDVMVVLNNKVWKNSAEKHRLEMAIENSIDVKTDINLVVYGELISLLPYSPLLQTELEDYNVVYGSIRLAKKIIISKTYLYRRLLEVEYVLELGKDIKSKYIYNAIRDCLSIELFLKRIVDNKLIMKITENNIGESTAQNLMGNKANPTQRDIALKYLKYLYTELEAALKN